ncbi:MAG: hypothetical protein EKK61_03705 [Rickettsiales bacterium]|nr:MAG: hypothetical protein EKK61_03705 [Rickettsiales bacterium]
MKNKKFVRVKKYNAGGLTGIPFGQLGQMGQMYGEEMSTKEDGTVNEGGYIASSALGMAGQGAAIGTMIAPGIGTAIGAGVGAVGGAFLGKSKAKKLNAKIAGEKREEELYNRRLQEQIDDQKRLQQSMYNQGYYAVNSMTGNANASIYAKYGAVLPKYPGGGEVKPLYKKEYLKVTDLSRSLNKDKDDLVSNDIKGITPEIAKNLGFEYVSGSNKTKDAIYKKGNDYYYYGEQKLKDGGVDYGLFKRKENTETKPLINNVLNNNKTSKPNTENKRKAVDFQFASQGIIGYTDLSKPQSSDNKFYLDSKGNVVDWNKMLNEKETIKNPNLKENIIIENKFGGYTYAPGGVLKSLSNNSKKAIGDTHEQDSNKDGQTGIMLEHKGVPFAEVENGEVVKGNKVFSNRLPYINGKTIAKEAEKISKDLGKYEDKLENNFDRISQNTSKRSIDNNNNKLSKLFNYQENLKDKLGIENQVKKFEQGGEFYGRIDNYLGQSIPMIDNVYNNMLTNKMPKIPKNEIRQIMNASAMPLKTTINVDKQLQDANDYYRQFNKNIDDNTSSSSISRANKLAAFSETLKNRNNIFTNKENQETRLKNQNALNIQQINNQNQANAQNIINQNLALKDNYNINKMNREAQIRAEKSKNMENLTKDMMKGLQDKRSSNLDSSRMFNDALKDNTGSALANQLDSNDFAEGLRSNPDQYELIEERLANRPNDLAKFKKMYPKEKYIK